MPSFDANISQLYTDLDFLDRFQAAANDGFQGVEFRGPYDYPVDVIGERLSTNELEPVLFNLPAGDWLAGERGIACHPGREAEFQEGLELAIEYALILPPSELSRGAYAA